jgi:uncharacterized protein YggE
MTNLRASPWITAWVAASALALPGLATAAEAPLRLVSVTGSGEVRAQPDMARITLGVDARRPTINEARTQVNATVEKLLALTRELKIDPKHVDSTRLNVQPDYRWDEKTSTQVLLGYVVNRQIEIELRDLDQLGPLLERAVTAGANQVSSPQLDSSKRKTLERQALAAAVEDARLSADALAQAAGARLGPVQSLSAGGGGGPPPFMQRGMMAAAPMADAAEKSYAPSEMNFPATVSAQYTLLD